MPTHGPTAESVSLPTGRRGKAYLGNLGLRKEVKGHISVRPVGGIHRNARSRAGFHPPMCRPNK